MPPAETLAAARTASTASAVGPVAARRSGQPGRGSRERRAADRADNADNADNAERARPLEKTRQAERTPPTDIGRKPRVRSSRSPLRLGLAARLSATVAVTVAVLQALFFFLAAPTIAMFGVRAQVLFVLTMALGTAGAAGAAYWFGRRLAGRLGQISGIVEGTLQAGRRERDGDDDPEVIGRLVESVNGLAEAVAERERRILESALADPLTGLPNRALLADRIRHLIAVSQRSRGSFSIAVLDLDRFKFVNDTLGHATGDVLLKEVAGRLRATVREADTVGRLGGDEFVLLMAGDVDAARTICRRVIEAMQAPLRYKDQLIDIGVSIGIAVYPEHGQDDVTLLRHADSAMYRAKRSRSGEKVFDGDSGEVQRSYLSMLGEMRAALEGGQFVLDYQPKLALGTGLIAGFEGLVRWNHPIRGRVPPNEFIPFAEQTGFMRELTRWVIEQGASFSRKLADAGLELCISVNVSALDIENADFARTVMDALRKHPIEPRRLCLEITESGVVSESEIAMKNLMTIARLGVRLSVDDFGTGYATLKQLQRLPVNELKIDRSFISGIHRDRGNLTIVRSTIELGKQLGLKVVAEGVETLEEQRCLTSLGCDEIQGYYLAKPMPAADVAGWAEMRNALYENSREMHALLAVPRR
jgi:diguanylate cyclase (GGDEF)-like protein